MKLPQAHPFVVDSSTQAEAQKMANMRKRPVGIILSTVGDAYDEEVVLGSSHHYHHIAYPDGAKPPVARISVERSGTTR